MRVNPQDITQKELEELGLTARQARKLNRRANKLKSEVKKSVVHNEHILPQQENIKKLVPKNQKQKDLLDALEKYVQVLAIGAAGTGKTYVVAAWAAGQYLKGNVKKLVLTRPNEPCGSSLGLFPGTLEEKYAVWLAPIISVLNEFMGTSRFELALKRGDIIYQPMETIRGSSFNDSLVLVDEFQNLSEKELKALVTRIGENSKVIFSGDIVQSDIKNTGFNWFLNCIENSDELYDMTEIVEFGLDDVVRSKLCKAWLKAF